jgi:hypothetical protein
MIYAIAASPLPPTRSMVRKPQREAAWKSGIAMRRSSQQLAKMMRNFCRKAARAKEEAIAEVVEAGARAEDVEIVEVVELPTTRSG